MSLATVRARAQNGLVADEVVVEVHLGNGLPALNIVGLPEAAVREAKDRVRAALTVSGFSFPQQRITINLAPADLPKFGGRFDLPIALGILLAQQALPAGCLDDLEVLGELSLSGEIRPVPGALPAALQATESGRGLILPAANLAEARLCRAAALYPMHHFFYHQSHVVLRETLQLIWTCLGVQQTLHLLHYLVLASSCFTNHV